MLLLYESLSPMELNREADDRHLKTVEKSVKNKFRWQWLETTVEITLKRGKKIHPSYRMDTKDRHTRQGEV